MFLPFSFSDVVPVYHDGSKCTTSNDCILYSSKCTVPSITCGVKSNDGSHIAITIVL